MSFPRAYSTRALTLLRTLEDAGERGLTWTALVEASGFCETDLLEYLQKQQMYRNVGHTAWRYWLTKNGRDVIEEFRKAVAR